MSFEIVAKYMSFISAYWKLKSSIFYITDIKKKHIRGVLFDLNKVKYEAHFKFHRAFCVCTACVVRRRSSLLKVKWSRSIVSNQNNCDLSQSYYVMKKCMQLTVMKDYVSVSQIMIGFVDVQQQQLLQAS